MEVFLFEKLLERESIALPHHTANDLNHFGFKRLSRKKTYRTSVSVVPSVLASVTKVRRFNPARWLELFIWGIENLTYTVPRRGRKMVIQCDGRYSSKIPTEGLKKRWKATFSFHTVVAPSENITPLEKQ